MQKLTSVEQLVPGKEYLYSSYGSLCYMKFKDIFTQDGQRYLRFNLTRGMCTDYKEYIQARLRNNPNDPLEYILDMHQWKRLSGKQLGPWRYCPMRKRRPKNRPMRVG